MERVGTNFDGLNRIDAFALDLIVSRQHVNELIDCMEFMHYGYLGEYGPIIPVEIEGRKENLLAFNTEIDFGVLFESGRLNAGMVELVNSMAEYNSLSDCIPD